MLNDKSPAPDQSVFYSLPEKSVSSPNTATTSSSADEEPGCLSSLKSWFCGFFGRSSSSSSTTEQANAAEDTETVYSAPQHAHVPPPPSLFPEWTPAELETLINRWLCTHPGPLNHPQNIELSSLLTLLDSSTATSSDASILHASLLHRLKMDHQIETLAREIGLYFHPTPLHASPEHAPPSDAIPGIEDFPPPPMAPLTVEARRLLLGCRGEWKEAVMPLPKTGVRCRYRKPKYWIVSVAAANGWTSDMLDARIGEWFMGWEGEEGGFDRISGPPGSPLAVGV